MARDKNTRILKCHVFRCDTPAKAIATSLHEICSRVRGTKDTRPSLDLYKQTQMEIDILITEFILQKISTETKAKTTDLLIKYTRVQAVVLPEKVRIEIPNPNRACIVLSYLLFHNVGI